MLPCAFRPLVVLYWMLAIFTSYKMISVWDSVSAFTCLHRIFRSTDYTFENGLY